MVLLVLQLVAIGWVLSCLLTFVATVSLLFHEILRARGGRLLNGEYVYYRGMDCNDFYRRLALVYGVVSTVLIVLTLVHARVRRVEKVEDEEQRPLLK